MKILALIILLPLLSFGQKTNTLHYKNATYIGETKKEMPHGKGKMTYTDGTPPFDGLWNDGREWTGQTAVIKYTAEDKDGKYDSGEFEGEIKDGEPWNGKLTMIDDKRREIFKGEIKNGLWWDGKHLEKNCGNYQTIHIKDGKRNDRNYYNKKDIIGNTPSTTIKLNTTGIEYNLWKKNSIMVGMEIGEVAHNWYFDTGAEGITISRSVWNKMNKNTRAGKNLNICQTATGATEHEKNDDLYLIDEIKIGEYVVKNVVVQITNSKYSLLGISFFEKFKNVKWDMQKNTLTLYK